MNIIKSPNDKNDYHTFKLKNNLKVFLELDKNIKISCVMIIVNIGYTIDKFNGMAHFLEHMLFNGTSQYPDEKFFSDFITKNGGHTNAFTTHNYTCYYYTIDNDFVEKSLEIFSQFFISPLFKKDTVNREREAVNSEHEKNINDDDWRHQNVLKHALNKNHPYTKFSTGSNKTLDVPNIDEEIRELFNSYYSSDLMTLCVVTNNNVKNIQNIIKQNFNKITIKLKPNLPKQSLALIDSPKIIYIVPVADVTKLSFYWEIPSFRQLKHKNPTNFILYLMSHEGKDTLHNKLSECGYILNLNCNIYEEVCDSSILYVDVTLSENGESNIEKITNMVYDYINLIKKMFICSDIHLQKLYKEQQSLNNYFFQFREKIDPETKCMQYYETLSSCDIPLKYLLVINYLSDDFDAIKNNAICILNNLSSDNCIFAYTSKKYENIAKMTDENYGTHYLIENKKQIVNESGIEMFLPKINNYMSFKTSLIKLEDKNPIQRDIGYLFRTTGFENPKVKIDLKIFLPLTLLNSFNYTQTLVYFASIMLNVGHEIYMCETAGYDVEITYNMGHINISIQGNFDKIDNVTNFFTNSLLNPQFTQNEFNRTVYSFKQNDTNLAFEAPYTRVANYFNKYAMSKFYTNNDRLECYDLLKYTDTINKTKKYFVLGTFDLLISGNCDENLYNKLTNILKNLKPKYEYNSKLFLDNILLLDNFNKTIKIKKENPNEKNNSVGTYLYIATIKNLQNDLCYRCMLDIINKFISPDYFFQLRTQEKFGYIVGSGIVLVENYKINHLYFRFIVQSKKNVSNIISRTSQFIDDFETKINSITESEFKDVVNACIKIAEELPVNLDELANIKMNEIIFDLNTFDSKKLFVSCYNSFTLNDVKLFYNKYFKNNKKMFVCL